MRYLRIVIGLVVWTALAVVLAVWARANLFDLRGEGHRAAADLWEFAVAKRQLVTLELDGPWPLAIGDPIYRVEGPDLIEQIGEVRRLISTRGSKKGGSAAGPTFEALLYPNSPPLGRGSYLKYYTTPRSLTWIMETMLPPEKRAAIAREIVSAYEAYHAEIFDAIKPIVAAGFVDAMRVAEDDLARAVARRRGQLDRLGSRYQDEVVKQELVPLVRDEIWPIVWRQAEPLVRQIGEELFARASLWRFGWRALYDKSILPEKNLTQAEWNRFVNEEAIPVLRGHRGDIVSLQRQIVKTIADNQRVRNVVRRNLVQVVDDPEFRAIVWQIFREVVVDNPRLRQTLEERWSTEEAGRAMQLAATYVEPCVRRIGDMLLGTREEGIAPEFAQVLRNQILDKDCRWLVLAGPGEPEPLAGPAERAVLPVRDGGYPEASPFAVQLEREVR